MKSQIANNHLNVGVADPLSKSSQVDAWTSVRATQARSVSKCGAAWKDTQPDSGKNGNNRTNTIHSGYQGPSPQAFNFVQAIKLQ